ncbi:MAG: cytochrome-c oxidase, cbb3-type subunit III [Marinosulfonomonas sp.]|nr:cytochrome-c oxidase, cbb3-type subunit III [Marinosulfonomonas sp.]
MSKKPEQQEVETTGHSWDGIEELNNPLPRWWVWTFYATIIWGILYMIAYPAWPLINGATRGVLGFSTRAEVAADIQAVAKANAAIEAKLAAADLTTMSADTELQNYAVNAGGAVFRTNCSQCHGSGAAGAKGYPNLLDDDWLWGGDIEAIAYTIRHGVRNDTDDAHYSEMSAFGEFLEDVEITQVVNHVMSLTGQEHDAGLAATGAAVFEENCASCHMEDGSGDRDQGAPNLTDAIWLYGGDAETITATITNGRFGVMPAWGPRLSDAQVNAVAAYVHQLGGGE